MKRFIPILVIALIFITAYYFELFDLITTDNLKSNHLLLKDKVAAHPIGAPMVYFLFYIFATGISLPGAILLTMIGGYLFAQPYSTIYVTFGATLGSAILFMAARTALGDSLKERMGMRFHRIGEGLRKDGAYYLLFMRFVPIFPFWVVNLAPAFFGITLWTYLWTTFIGIIPGVIVYTLAGQALATVIETENGLDFFTPEMKIALVLLGFFALIPLIAKKIRDNNNAR